MSDYPEELAGSGAESGVGYTIGAVAQQTGLRADTLRVWERRYGFPCPERDESGIRRFSPGDVERLCLIARALSGGHRVSDVIGLEPIVLKHRLNAVANMAPSHQSNGAARRVIDAVISLNLFEAQRELRLASVAFGTKSFVRDYASPLVEELGRVWAVGGLEVWQEHLISELLVTQLRAVLSTFDLPRNCPRIVLASLPGEGHGLGLDLAAVYLSSLGIACSIVGRDSPIAEIARAAQGLNAKVVGISVSAAADLASVKSNLVELTHSLPEGIGVWVGGVVSAELDLPRGVVATPSWDDVDIASARLIGSQQD